MCNDKRGSAYSYQDLESSAPPPEYEVCVSSAVAPLTHTSYSGGAAH
jgi:hypothetical protein